uniref:Solute carrier family 22 member 23 n=1 Tax=Sus scrofa TaxID=9823 RepID=A0A4X1SN77_PIG
MSEPSRASQRGASGPSTIRFHVLVEGIELCPPGKRFTITMVASFVAMAGQFLMPGLAALCRDWQVLQALIICPFLLMLLYWSIFPESLRWLMATHQFESAKKLILYFTQKNRMSPESDIKGVMPELEKELSRRPKKVCIVKVVGTRNLWKNIVVLCVNSLTGFGIHHCFARSMMGHEVKVPLLENFYADYYTAAGIALASCLAMCLVVGVLGRRGGLLLFMILTALASLLQLGLLNLIGKYSQHPDSGMSDSVKDKFSVTFSIVGMFASHAAGSLSVFFCAEITPTVIRCVAGLPEVGGGLPRPRGQGRPIWQGARGPATSPGLWSQLPDGRPALPPGAWRVRGELEPGSHLGSWRNGVQGARGARAAAGPAQRAKSGLTEFMPTLSTLPEPSEEPGRGRGRGGRKGLASAGLRSQCHASRGRP